MNRDYTKGGFMNPLLDHAMIISSFDIEYKIISIFMNICNILVGHWFTYLVLSWGIIIFFIIVTCRIVTITVQHQEYVPKQLDWSLFFLSIFLSIDISLHIC